jgi:hypothetical protein
MNKLKATPELLEAILSRIPEGFIELYTLRRRLSLPNKSTDLDALLNETSVGREKNHLYDKTRVTPEQISERARWAHHRRTHRQPQRAAGSRAGMEARVRSAGEHARLCAD